MCAVPHIHIQWITWKWALLVCQGWRGRVVNKNTLHIAWLCRQTVSISVLLRKFLCLEINCGKRAQSFGQTGEGEQRNGRSWGGHNDWRSWENFIQDWWIWYWLTRCCIHFSFPLCFGKNSSRLRKNGGDPVKGVKAQELPAGNQWRMDQSSWIWAACWVTVHWIVHAPW